MAHSRIPLCVMVFDCATTRFKAWQAGGKDGAGAG